MEQQLQNRKGKAGETLLNKENLEQRWNRDNTSAQLTEGTNAVIMHNSKTPYLSLTK